MNSICFEGCSRDTFFTDLSIPAHSYRSVISTWTIIVNDHDSDQSCLRNDVMVSFHHVTPNTNYHCVARYYSCIQARLLCLLNEFGGRGIALIRTVVGIDAQAAWLRHDMEKPVFVTHGAKFEAVIASIVAHNRDLPVRTINPICSGYQS